MSLLRRLRSFKPSLLLTFSVVSFVLILALAVALAFGIQHQLEDSALKQEASHTADQVTMYITPRVQTSDLRQPWDLTSPRYHDLDMLIRETLLRDHIVRIKLWTREGTLLYSDRPELIGKTFDVDEELVEAFEGKMHLDVSTLSADENEFERGQFDRLLEIYLPFRAAGASGTGAVLEVYHDLAAVDARNDEMRGFIWTSLAAGFLALYGSLFTLVRSASRTLTRRNRENELLYHQASERLAERIKVEEALRYRIEFERLIMSISANFINLAPVEIENGIRQALRAVATFADVDRTYVFQLDGPDRTTMSNTYEWCARGIVPLSGMMQRLPVESFPWIMKKLNEGDVVYIPRVDELPDAASAERSFLKSVSSRSLLLVPMVYNKTLVGFLGLDFVRQDRAWSDESIILLKIVAEIFVNALERKRAADALRESDGRFRAVFESTALAIALSDRNGRVVQANPALEDLVGYSQDELVGKTFADITHPDDVNLNTDYFRQLMEGQRSHYSMEKRYIRKDGSIVWVNLLVSLLRDARGNPQFAIAMVENVTERKRSQEEIRRQLNRLAALRTIDNAITSSFDLHATLRVILDQVTTQLHVDAASVLLLSQRAGAGLNLDHAAGAGFRSEAAARSRTASSKSAAQIAAVEQRLVSIPNLDPAAPDTGAELVEGEGFRAYFAVPLVAKGKVVGVLELFHRTPIDPKAEWVDFLETLAGQTAIAVDNATLFQDLQRYNLELALAYDTTLEGWSHALDLRDKETEGHTQRVTEMTVRLARSMGIGEPELLQIRRGALLHDIGKMGIPDSILLKPGPLTDDEWLIMRLHPIYAYDLLSPIAFLHPALDIPYCHHEKWDGTGYPRGLKGEEIPLAARIFAIVDVYDALRSDRPYRSAWPEEKVIEYLRGLSGTHFDPQVVDAFLDLDRTPFQRTPTTPELVLDRAGR